MNYEVAIRSLQKGGKKLPYHNKMDGSGRTGMLTWISLESGWEARTPVQVRSESLSAATASTALAAAEEEDEEGAGTLAPLLAAAAAFFCAAFFLLASDTMVRRMGRVRRQRQRPDEEAGRRIGKVGEGRQRSTPPPDQDCGNVKQTTGEEGEPQLYS